MEFAWLSIRVLGCFGVFERCFENLRFFFGNLKIYFYNCGKIWVYSFFSKDDNEIVIMYLLNIFNFNFILILGVFVGGVEFF